MEKKNPLGPQRPMVGTSSELQKDHLSYVEHLGLSEGVRQALGNHLSPRILAKGKVWGSDLLPRRLYHSFRFLYR